MFFEVCFLGDPTHLEFKEKEFIADLQSTLQNIQKKQTDQMKKFLYHSIGEHLKHSNISDDILLPMHIQIQPSDNLLCISIQASDTPLFLFSFSNALTSQGIEIISMDIQTEGIEVRDIIWVKDRYNRYQKDPQFGDKT